MWGLGERLTSGDATLFAGLGLLAGSAIVHGLSSTGSLILSTFVTWFGSTGSIGFLLCVTHTCPDICSVFMSVIPLIMCVPVVAILGYVGSTVSTNYILLALWYMFIY